MRATRSVVARQADNEKTNKISSPQPSPKERECINGKVRQKNERTKDEQKTVRTARAKERMTNNERTMNEQKTNNERRKDEQ